MQRTRIAADDAKRVSQESHQWAEVAMIEEWIRGAAGFVDLGRQLFFTRAVVDDAAQAQCFTYLFAEHAEPLGRPALGAPTSSGAESNVSLDALTLQVVTDSRCV